MGIGFDDADADADAYSDSTSSSPEPYLSDYDYDEDGHGAGQDAREWADMERRRRMRADRNVRGGEDGQQWVEEYAGAGHEVGRRVRQGSEGWEVRPAAAPWDVPDLGGPGAQGQDGASRDATAEYEYGGNPAGDEGRGRRPWEEDGRYRLYDPEER